LRDSFSDNVPLSLWDAAQRSEDLRRSFAEFTLSCAEGLRMTKATDASQCRHESCTRGWGMPRL